MNEAFYLFLHSWVIKVREMQIGDVLVIPGGWTTYEADKNAPADIPAPNPKPLTRKQSKQAVKKNVLSDDLATKGAKAALGPKANPLAVKVLSKVAQHEANARVDQAKQDLHLEKEPKKALPAAKPAAPKRKTEKAAEHRRTVMLVMSLAANKTFTLSIVNPCGLDEKDQDTGGEYHHQQFDTVTGKMKRDPSVTFQDIPKTRLLDSSFWFMFFRLKVYPHKDNTSSFLYRTLLPYLNASPLYSNPRVKDMYKTQNGQRDESFFHLIKASMRCCLLHIGTGRPEVKRFGVELRREFVEMAHNDVRAHASRLTEEECTLVKLACQQLAKAAGKQADALPKATALKSHLEEVSVVVQACLQDGKKGDCWVEERVCKCVWLILTLDLFGSLLLTQFSSHHQDGRRCRHLLYLHRQGDPLGSMFPLVWPVPNRHWSGISSRRPRLAPYPTPRPTNPSA